MSKDELQEEWRTIYPFTDYEMNADADVREKETGRLMKIVRNPKGYPMVWITANHGTDRIGRGINKLHKQLFPEMHLD